MFPLIQSICVTLVSKQRMPVALSTFFIGMDLGFGFGPILLGTVLEVAGYQSMYLGSTAVVLFAIVVYWAVHGRSAGRRPYT